MVAARELEVNEPPGGCVFKVCVEFPDGLAELGEAHSADLTSRFPFGLVGR
jgi:hypothetical protein